MNKMPTKIKILLFAMIAGAGLIVFSVFANINGVSNLGANISQVLKSKENDPAANGNNPIKINPESCSNIDKDGLCDNEEPLYRTDPLNPDTDGDGFLDGEEVAAGCSPISASPKDCDLSKLGNANLSKINLTDYFASLVVGGFLSGDLNKSNPDFQKHLNKLTGEIAQIQKMVLLTDNSDLKTAASDDSENASQEYLNNLENVLAKYFFKKGGKIDVNNLNEIDFSSYLKDLNNISGGLSKLKPPPSWMETHKNLAQFILTLKTYLTNLSNQENDPIKTRLTLKSTQGLLDEYEKLIKDVKEKIKNSGLKTTIFNL